MPAKEKVSKVEVYFFKALGILISLLGLSMYFIPMFWEVKKDYTKDGWYIPILVMVFGMSTFLYYKKVGAVAINYLERKIDNEEEDQRKPTGEE